MGGGGYSLQSGKDNRRSKTFGLVSFTAYRFTAYRLPLTVTAYRFSYCAMTVDRAASNPRDQPVRFASSENKTTHRTTVHVVSRVLKQRMLSLAAA